jgi:hypothetical protein
VSLGRFKNCKPLNLKPLRHHGVEDEFTLQAGLQSRFPNNLRIGFPESVPRRTSSVRRKPAGRPDAAKIGRSTKTGLLLHVYEEEHEAQECVKEQLHRRPDRPGGLSYLNCKPTR